MNALSLPSFLGKGECVCVCVCVCVCKDLNVRERDWAYVMISPWLRLTAMSLIPWDRGFIPKLQTRASWHCLEPNTRQLLIWLAAVLITSPLFLLYQTASLGMVAGVVLVWFPAVNPLVELFSLLQVSSSCVVCLYPRATHFQCSFLAPVPTSPFALSVLLEISYSGPSWGSFEPLQRSTLSSDFLHHLESILLFIEHHVLPSVKCSLFYRLLLLLSRFSRVQLCVTP